MLYQLLDTPHFVGTGFAETVLVELLNELRERHLPRFLIVVVELAQLRRVQAKFTSHLHVGVGQTVTFPCLNPGPVFLGDLHRISLAVRLALALEIAMTLVALDLVSETRPSCSRIW